MRPLPRAEVAFAAFDPRPFAAVAHCTVTNGADDSRMQIVVPKPLARGNDLDVMGHG